MQLIDKIRQKMIESAMAPADLRIALQILREAEEEQKEKEGEQDVQSR